MKELGIIRRMFYRDGLSLSEIERRTGLTRKTVRLWLKAAERAEPKYRRQSTDTKMAPFAAQLVKMLETEALRLKRERRTALKLFGELKALGFTGDYSRVTEFVRRWRANGRHALSKAFVPLHVELGEAFQFDWSEERLVIGGVWRKILAAHMKLCASRACVVRAYPTQSHDMLFDAPTRAFTALGGIARRGIDDTPSTRSRKARRASSIRASPRWRRTICSNPIFATLPAVGKKASLRRMFRTAGRVSGKRPPKNGLAPLANSISGYWPGAACCGTN